MDGFGGPGGFGQTSFANNGFATASSPSYGKKRTYNARFSTPTYEKTSWDYCFRCRRIGHTIDGCDEAQQAELEQQLIAKLTSVANDAEKASLQESGSNAEEMSEIEKEHEDEVMAEPLKRFKEGEAASESSGGHLEALSDGQIPVDGSTMDAEEQAHNGMNQMPDGIDGSCARLVRFEPQVRGVDAISQAIGGLRFV